MLLVYGANGYSGALVSHELARRGIAHVVAGRRESEVLAHARAVGAESRVFAVEDAERGLAGATTVLNCAGPFARTAVPLAAACLRAGAHYLDLAGEVDEHLAIAALGDEARARGVMLLPGVGFGVVPTELAAARAAEALGHAPERIVTAFETRGGASKGTLATLLPALATVGVARRGGELVPWRPGERAEMDFGDGPIGVVSNPWRADLVAAHASTGAGEILTYATFPFAARFMMTSPRLMSSGFGRWIVARAIASAPAGPTDAELAKGSTRVLAVAEAQGRRAEVRVHGPEAYVFTARAAAECARRVLAGVVRPGFAPPSALGLDLLESIEGVVVS
jgi:short subunit dehydrogenase-like uncharacterized protein